MSRTSTFSLKPFGLALGSWALLSSCTDHELPGGTSYPSQATVSTPKVLATFTNDFTRNLPITAYNGGFGSAMAVDPNDPQIFYLLTDRGPNTDGVGSDAKVFPVPDFAPQIGKFRLEGGELKLIETIELKDATGKKLTGLPNPVGSGNAGELAQDMNLQPLSPATDPNGLDSEGLVAMADGSFWVSDEYGPHIVHFDRTGRTLRRLNPFNTGADALPQVLAKRWPNRGMEGLTITPDGKTLVGIMQNTLRNPNKATADNSTVLRILTYQIETGVTQQFIYLMDKPNPFRVSEITAITNTTFLVLERNDDALGGGNTPVKNIFKIDITGATDVSDSENKASGKLFGGKTLEELPLAEWPNYGIKSVKKEFVVDVIQAIPNYPHDKVEGLVVLSPTLIAVANDDDFGLATEGTSANRKMIQKILPSVNKVDFNAVYFISLPKALK
ncbi:esterase-like activity of phytase family protein [Siphonobacter curvatus]|uniref:Phytase-like domain-containing protein n=1 Tax=Siphonobacter curvatus TaxID=2094562 RepID=A0A2S7IFT8_9BACT|nr:esterase-like activity of phytase family protein [Siphonobacter curvatus]PQA54090.1 hypothetical protein C5O19_23270 [Siphonobacter curvatus]